MLVQLNRRAEILKKKPRRTLENIARYPKPRELLEKIQFSPGWKYKTRIKYYQSRDRALASLCYILALRISEALRLKKSQFTEEKDRIVVNSIKVSKRSKKWKIRRIQYRIKGWLPKSGKRKGFTEIIMAYLNSLEKNEKLFKFTRQRAWQIITALLDEPCHWLRAYGENFLYDEWDHDILAVAQYVAVDPRTLQEYIRRGYEKYQPA